MKKIYVLLLFVALLAPNLFSMVQRNLENDDLVAYDGFSGFDYGWMGAWSEFNSGFCTRRVYDDCFTFSSNEVELSYSHSSGILIKGGSECLKASYSDSFLEARALVRKPLDLEILEDTFYLSFLARFSEQPDVGLDYIAVGAKQDKYDSGLGLGSIGGSESLGAAFARDRAACAYFGEHLPQADVSYFVVGKFFTNSDGVVDRIDCYVNPTSPDVEQAQWTSSVSEVVTQMTTIDLQAYFHDVAYFDEVRLGLTWNSVVCSLDNSNNAYNPVGNVTTFIGPSGLWSDPNKWSNGLPTAATDTVIIDGCCTVNDVVSVDNIVVLPSACLNVVGQGRIDSEHPIVLKAGKGVFAEYVQDTCVVEHFVSKEEYFYGGQWNFVCVPEPMTANELFPDLQMATTWGDQSADYWILDYSQEQRAESYDGMVEVLDGNYPLLEGRGYIVWLTMDKVRAYEYSTSMNEMYVNTTNTTNTTTASVPLNHSGWNLVGNPFPHSMSYEAVFDSCGHNQEYFTGAVYVWDGDCYKVWSRGAGDEEAREINPMEAFFVKRTGDDPASAFFRMTDDGTQLSSTTEPSSKAANVSLLKNTLAISINLDKGNGSDYTYVKFEEDASVEFDEMLDAGKVFSDRTEYPDHDFIYSVDGVDQLALNSVSLDMDYAEIPLVIDLSNNMDSILLGFALQGDSSYVYTLIDEDKMTMTPINHGDLISFPTYDETLIKGRFSVFVTKAPDKETSIAETSSVDLGDIAVVYSENSTLHVDSNSKETTSLSVIDFNGRLMVARKLAPEETCVLPMSEGAYLVRLFDGTSSYVHKVIIK